MKKYIAPAVEINETQTFAMMALSLQNGTASSTDPVLSEGDGLNIWEEEDAE